MSEEKHKEIDIDIDDIIKQEKLDRFYGPDYKPSTRRVYQGDEVYEVDESVFTGIY